MAEISLDELLKKQKELSVLIDQAKKRAITKGLAELDALTVKYLLTPEMIAAHLGLSKKRTTTAQRKKAGVKYHHPQDATLTWTGRGRKPKWIDEYLAQGNTLESLLVSARPAAE